MKELHSFIKKENCCMPTKCSYYFRSWREKEVELDICLFSMSSQFKKGDRRSNRDRENKLEQEIGARM